MATIDLRNLSGNDFVLHFGGRPNNVDAFTFANSLLSISEALREINLQVNPDFSIEIAIDAVGTGSFRARLKTKAKKLTKLLRSPMKEIIVGLLTAFLYDKAFGDKIQVVVNDDSYVVEHGSDRIILPREVYTAKQKLRAPERVDSHISRAFTVLDSDKSISEFGITNKLTDKVPLVRIPRSSFPTLAQPIVLERDDENHRFREVNATLVIVKLVLEKSNRKWQFIWNGHKISAPITDETFFVRLAAREFEFAQGDALEAVLGIHQVRDEATGAFINERYEVARVISKIPAYKQPDWPAPGSVDTRLS